MSKGGGNKGERKEERGRGGVTITTDSRILPQLNCSGYREKLNTTMWKSYQNAINRISRKVDSLDFFFLFY